MIEKVSANCVSCGIRYFVHKADVGHPNMNYCKRCRIKLQKNCRPQDIDELELEEAEEERKRKGGWLTYG